MDTMSALGQAPLDIWGEILSHILESSIYDVEHTPGVPFHQYSEKCRSAETEERSHRNLITSIRLVCKMWNSLAAPYLHNTLHLYSSSPATASPRLGKTIRIVSHIRTGPPHFLLLAAHLIRNKPDLRILEIWDDRAPGAPWGAAMLAAELCGLSSRIPSSMRIKCLTMRCTSICEVSYPFAEVSAAFSNLASLILIGLLLGNTSDPMSLPFLSTLIIFFTTMSADTRSWNFTSWKLPSLRSLDIQIFQIPNDVVFPINDLLPITHNLAAFSLRIDPRSGLKPGSWSVEPFHLNRLFPQVQEFVIQGWFPTVPKSATAPKAATPKFGLPLDVVVIDDAVTSDDYNWLAGFCSELSLSRQNIELRFARLHWSHSHYTGRRLQSLWKDSLCWAGLGPSGILAWDAGGTSFETYKSLQE